MYLAIKWFAIQPRLLFYQQPIPSPMYSEKNAPFYVPWKVHTHRPRAPFAPPAPQKLATALEEFEASW